MEPPFLDTSGRRLWQPRIGFIRGNADLFGSSGPDLLQAFGQVTADGSPGSARSARICSATPGRISFKCSAWWRSRIGTAGAVGVDLLGCFKN